MLVQRQQTYDSDLGQLAAMRACIREACHESWQGQSADEDLIARLTLALTEAASNIILHSDQGQQSRSISLTIAVDENQACVTLQHFGSSFDPQAAAAPVFDGSRENGFGLYLIRECVDEVRYDQDDQGRCTMQLVLKRKLDRQKERGQTP